MDPFTLAALITGGGGLLSSIFGGISESQANARQDALYAQQLKDSKLGSTDARGNRTYFKEGVGWVTEYGPIDAALERYFLSQELPARQDQFRRADIASRGEDATASALLDQFRRTERGNPAEIENLLYSQAARGIGQQAQDANNVLMRNILRSGATNNGQGIERINKSAMEALGNAGVDSKLKALDYVDSKYNTDRSNTSSLYNLFANRSRQDLDATTGATTPTTTNVVGSNQGNYQSAGADNGLANAIGGATSAIGGALNTLGSSQQNNSTNALLNAFLTGSGGFNMNNGGIFGSINDRTRTRSGAF